MQKGSASSVVISIHNSLNGLGDKLRTKVDWEASNDKVLWATLRPNPRGILPILNPKLVISLLGPMDRVWFNTVTDTAKNHIDMLHLLGSKGIQFQAWARFKRGALDAGSIFASTNDPQVIQGMFQIYGIDWLGHSNFFLCISEKDLSSRRNEIENLTSTIPRNLLDDIRCMIATYYDHSLEVVTTKLNPQEIAGAAKEAASSLGLSLKLEEVSS